jgi:hypothetical protein
MILIQLDGTTVIAQRNDKAIASDEGWIDVSKHPDGPDFMGRTQLADGSFAPIVPAAKSRREILKVKATWTVEDRDEALKILL